MPVKPPAEIAIDAALVRSLVAAQATHAIPDAAMLTLEKVAEGWDEQPPSNNLVIGIGDFGT